MIRRRAQSGQRRGATAVVMVVVMLLVTIIVLGAALSGGRDQDLSVRRIETIQSMYAAEAGMNMAIRELVNDTDEDGDGGVGTISDDDDAETGPSVGFARVSVTTTASGDDTIAVSMGTWGAAQRRIKATLTGQAASGPGLRASYFDEPGALAQLADVNWNASPDATGTVLQLNTPDQNDSGNPFWVGGPDTTYGAQFTGTITVPSTGTWTFYTDSDDGSKLWIDGTLVVDNDGLHSMREISGTIALSAGDHDFKLQFFENQGRHGLIVRWQGPGGSPAKQVIPGSAFSH